MSDIQLKFIIHAKKQKNVIHNQGKKSIKRKSHTMSEIMKLVYKNFKTATINMLLDLKENTSKTKKEMEPVKKK